MLDTLEYARPVIKRRTNRMLIGTLIFGLCSGPLACFVFGAVQGMDNRRDFDRDFDFRACLAFFAVLIAAFALACVAGWRVRTSSSRSDRKWAKIAIATPIVWGVVIIGPLYYVVTQI